LINTKEKNQIEKLFRDKEYKDLYNLIDKIEKRGETSKLFYLYKYFFCEATSKPDLKQKAFKDAKIAYGAKLDELYYDMGITCPNLQNLHLSFFTSEDVLRFYRLSLNFNTNHVEANFEIGKLLFDFNININKGMKYVNKAVSSKPSFEIRKADFLYESYIGNYSPSKLKLMLKELDSLSSKFKGNKYLMKRALILINLKRPTEAIQELRNVDTSKRNQHEIHNYNDYYFRCYLHKKDYINAEKYSKLIGQYHLGKFYFKTRAYTKAITVFKKLPSKKANNPLDANIYIAESFIKLSKLKSAKNTIDKNLNLAKLKIYSLDYLRSLMIKSKIFLLKNKYEESLNFVNQSLLFLSENGKKYFPENFREKVVLQKITILAEQHLSRFRNRPIKIGARIRDLNDVKKIINDIEMAMYFNTWPKVKMEKEIKALLFISNRNIKQVQCIENKVNRFEKKYSDKCYRAIEKLILSAMGKGITNNDLYLKLAVIKHNLKDYKKCIVIYKKLLVHEPDNSTYLNNLAVAYSENNQKEKSISIVKEAIKTGELHNKNMTALDNLLTFLSDKSKSDKVIKKEVFKAKDRLIKEVLVFDSQLSRLTNNGFNNIQNLKLFKYKTFCTNTIDSLMNGYLYFSNITKLNDPIDIPLIEMSSQPQFTMLHVDPKDIEVLSLSQEENNTLMWSHYADSHKGICIGYQFTSLPSFIGWDFVNYIPESYDYNRAGKSKGLISAGFYSKHENWKYEKEVRLVTFKNKKNKIKYAYPINPEEKDKKVECYIAEITLGYRFKESHLKIIRSIIKDINSKREKFYIPKVKLYKTSLNPNYPFKLKKGIIKT
jgi:tetratricopeptide (TPR) repeat protein